MLTWPLSSLPPQESAWHLRLTSVSGGTSVNGLNRLSMTDGGGRWTCSMSGVWLRRPEQIKLARALESLMDGGAGLAVVPACERAFAPLPGGGVVADVPHGDDASFGDGALYGASSIVVTADAAPLRATTLTVTRALAAALIGGERFSIDHPARGKRLYTVSRVEAVSDGVDRITIRPPLREAITDDTVLDFDNPGCVMRLANPDEFFEPIRLHRFSYLNPTFVEAFDAS